MNRLRYLCASAALGLLLSACSYSARTAPGRFRNCSPEPSLGLHHSLRTELRGVSRYSRTRRSSDFARRSCLSRHR